MNNRGYFLLGPIPFISANWGRGTNPANRGEPRRGKPWQFGNGPKGQFWVEEEDHRHNGRRASQGALSGAGNGHIGRWNDLGEGKEGGKGREGLAGVGGTNPSPQIGTMTPEQGR